MENRGENTDSPRNGVVAGGVSLSGKKGVSQRSLLVLLIGIVVVLVVAGGVIHHNRSTSQSSNFAADSPERLALKEALNQPFPSTDVERELYYLELSTAYDGVKQYDKALEMILKADKYITDEERSEGSSLNLTIAYAYKMVGNNSKAKEYYQREIDRLKNRADAADNADVIKNIEKLKREV